MPDTYEEYKTIPNSTHFNPYFSTCPNHLQNGLADSLDDRDLDDSSQIDHLEINGVAHGDSTVDLPALIISSSTDCYDDRDLDSTHSENVLERPNRVRFRSRVRITSGLNRHRHKSQQQFQNQSGIDYLDFSPASSVSGSPSSSISAPLRTRTDEQVGKPGWGTLGQRVSLFAKGKIERKKIREQREGLGLGASSLRQGAQRGGFGGAPYGGTDEVNERSPLLLSLPSRDCHPVTNASDCSREDEASQMSREIGMVSGQWPDRLANKHWWWWWQFEPIVCCRCLTESDDEG